MNILISGGTSGLGKELAVQFSQQGHRVAVFSRNPQEEIFAGERILVLRGDVALKESVIELRKQLQKQNFRVDWLINNAGISEQCAPYGNPILGAQWRAVIETNVVGPLQMIETFHGDLVSSQDARIINMTSVLAHYPAGFFPVYSASKAFVSALSKALGAVRAGPRVRVQEVVLPMLDTPMAKDIVIARIKKMSAKKAAKEILEKINLKEDRIAIGDARVLMMLRRFIAGKIQANFDAMSNDYINTVNTSQMSPPASLKS